MASGGGNSGVDFGECKPPEVQRIDWMYEQEVTLTEKEQEEKMNEDALAALAAQTVNASSEADRTGKGALFQQRASGSELLNKVRDDPMFMIKQEEMRREKLLEANPLVQARLAAAKEQKEDRERRAAEIKEMEKIRKRQRKEEEKRAKKIRKRESKKEAKKEKKKLKKAKKKAKRQEKRAKKEKRRRKGKEVSSDSDTSTDSESDSSSSSDSGSSDFEDKQRAPPMWSGALPPPDAQPTQTFGANKPEEPVSTETSLQNLKYMLGQSRSAALFGGAGRGGVNAFEERQAKMRERDQRNAEAAGANSRHAHRIAQQSGDRNNGPYGHGGGASSSGGANRDGQYREMSLEEKRKRLEDMRNRGTAFEKSKQKTFASLEELEAKKAKLEANERDKVQQRIDAGEEHRSSAAFLGKMASRAYMDNDQDLKGALKSRRGRQDKNLTDRYLERD
ncbi:unnamed protein product [Amoebophrya sp. A25]|nr:unnamed protein product [Amoebophrya sp. A25]|eukprot:GSA25T00021153001.1